MGLREKAYWMIQSGKAVSINRNILIGTGSPISEHDLYQGYITAYDAYKNAKKQVQLIKSGKFSPTDSDVSVELFHGLKAGTIQRQKHRDSLIFWNKAVKRQYRAKNYWSNLIKQFERKK